MFYGLDVHKDFIQVCRLAPKGKQRKDFAIPATVEAIEAFARRLTRKDQVALEVTFHSWAIHRLLVPHAGPVVAVNATQVRAMASARIKIDKVDAHTLAQLLPADSLCRPDALRGHLGPPTADLPSRAPPQTADRDEKRHPQFAQPTALPDSRRLDSLRAEDPPLDARADAPSRRALHTR
jgi:hypothetical protein